MSFWKKITRTTSDTFVKNKRIIVLGGAGSIGSELVRQLAPDNKIFIYDIDETRTFLLREELRNKGHWVHSRNGDVRNRESVFDVYSDYRPQITFNCAALKHVSTCEEYPEEAFATNIQGTYNTYYEARRQDCFEKYVYVSTDKVVNATSIMGISKKAGESYIRNRGGIAVRFGNVLGSRGSVVEIWEKQVKNDEPITITHPDMERYTMSITEACELLREAAQGEDGKLYIMDMGERKKIIDLKQELFGDYPHKIIGIRPGEEMVEELMTENEKQKAVRKGKFYVIS